MYYIRRSMFLKWWQSCFKVLKQNVNLNDSLKKIYRAWYRVESGFLFASSVLKSRFCSFFAIFTFVEYLVALMYVLKCIYPWSFWGKNRSHLNKRLPQCGCSKFSFQILEEREEPGFLTGLKIPAPWAAGKTVETLHPVRDNYKFKDTVHIPGARCLYLRFDPRCSSQYDYDKVFILKVKS